MKRQKSSQSGATESNIKQWPSGPTVVIASQIEKLNQRDRTIQARLGVIQLESSKLYNEQAGIQVKRIELMRAFDGAAKP